MTKTIQEQIQEQSASTDLIFDCSVDAAGMQAIAEMLLKRKDVKSLRIPMVRKNIIGPVLVALAHHESLTHLDISPPEILGSYWVVRAQMPCQHHPRIFSRFKLDLMRIVNTGVQAFRAVLVGEAMTPGKQEEILALASTSAARILNRFFASGQAQYLVGGDVKTLKDFILAFRVQVTLKCTTN